LEIQALMIIVRVFALGALLLMLTGFEVALFFRAREEFGLSSPNFYSDGDFAYDISFNKIP
jgi:hypothetical protein